MNRFFYRNDENKKVKPEINYAPGLIERIFIKAKTLVITHDPANDPKFRLKSLRSRISPKQFKIRKKKIRRYHAYLIHKHGHI